MGAAVNFKLLWFLCLSLLTQAHIIHKRQMDKDYQSQSLESLRPVQELLIKARQALSNDFNDLVSPPYDDVNFKHEVKLSEIKEKKDSAISTKNEPKVQENSGNSYVENKEKLLKIGNSESEETLKSNSGPVESHLIKAELSFANDNIETSSNNEFSENKGVLTAQPVLSKSSENFLKKENQNTGSTAFTADSSVNKNRISENSSTLKQNSQTSNSENKLDMKTQKNQLESGSYGEIKNKNPFENSDNNFEKESIYLNAKKEEKQVEKPLSEQKLNKNGLENFMREPEALKDPSEVSELENTTETLPLYTPVTVLPNVVIKKEPLPGSSAKPPLPKPNATAILPKPLALESAANADKTKNTVSSTTPMVIDDAKATEKPIIMSATQPTRRPILSFPTRRRTPQRPRPPLGLRPPAWFTNLPLLPLNPLLPNFFINPFNTSTTSATNQPTNNLGFGVFAIPWTWRPFNNINSFFSPNRILETRPLLQDESITTAETRDLALFHSDYKPPGAAIYKDSSEAHKNTENANDSYWKPSKFLKFFSDNGDTNDVATVPANTRILNVYFPIKYPFRGKIVQTPAYEMEEQNSANNEEILVKDDINPAEESINERALDATAHKSGDTDAGKKKDEKSSLLFELEMPKPVAQLFKGFMETFMPQQN